MQECSIQDRDAPQPRRKGGVGGGGAMLATAPERCANNHSALDAFDRVEQMTALCTCGFMSAITLVCFMEI